MCDASFQLHVQLEKVRDWVNKSVDVNCFERDAHQLIVCFDWTADIHHQIGMTSWTSFRNLARLTQWTHQWNPLCLHDVCDLKWQSNQCEKRL